MSGDKSAAAVRDETGSRGEVVSLAEQAYLVVRDRLVMLEIRPGSPIQDVHLAAALGFGRTPVREALKRLESDRLVVAYPRRGTFATEVNISDLKHISEVRQNLEPLAAATAARRASAAERVRCGELADELEDGNEVPREPRDLIHLDMRIHRAIYVATHNPYLEDTLVRYDNLATRIWCLFLARLSGLAGHVREHGPMLRAVIRGDAEEAADLSARHVAHFEETIRSMI